MRFTQLVTLCENDFMSGLEAYEDMNMVIYTWVRDSGFYTSTINDFKESAIDANNPLDNIFGIDVTELTARLKAGECVKGSLTRHGNNTPIWACTDMNIIKDISKKQIEKEMRVSIPTAPEDEL